MENLRLWANYYYNMGFNVTHIIPLLNEGKAKNPFKSPTNDRHKLKNERQTLEELNGFDWEMSTGVGVVLGFNQLRAIDFDFNGSFHSYLQEGNNAFGFKEYHKDLMKFIRKSLLLLSLPDNYEWVSLTPNGGFHIIILAEEHPFKVNGNLTKAFLPNESTHWYTAMSHIELRWDKHLVLPPSISENESNYKFAFCDIPTHMPLRIENNNISKMLDEFCLGNNTSASWASYEAKDRLKSNLDLAYGYNMHLSHYYELNEGDDFLKYYSFDEFLDFSPVYFKK